MLASFFIISLLIFMNKKIIIGLSVLITFSVFVIWFKTNSKKTEVINFEGVTEATKIEIIHQKDTLILNKNKKVWFSKNELEISENSIENFQNIIQNLQFKSFPTKNFYENLQQKAGLITNIYSNEKLQYSIAIIGSSEDGLSLYVQTIYPYKSDTILAYVIGNQSKLINYFSYNELEWTNKKVFPIKNIDFKSIAIDFPSKNNSFYINCFEKKITVNSNNLNVNEGKLSAYINAFSSVHFLSLMPCDKKSEKKLFSITINGYLKYEGFAIIENGVINRNFYSIQHQNKCYLMRYLDTDPLLINSEYLTK